ncbi:MAG: SnoaL-like domain-containing protein [Ekhidna sp.]
MSALENEQQLQSMMGQGQMMEAFEKFYHEDVVMIEGDGTVHESKAANRKREEEWLGMVSEMHGGGIGAMSSNEETGHTMTESWVDVSFKDGNRMKIEEVSVKKWEGDQIVNERFYYNMPG